MTTAQQRSTSPARLALYIALAAAGMALAIWLDKAAYLAISNEAAEREDWHRALRILGYLPTWLAIGIAFIMCDWDRSASKPGRTLLRGLYIMGSAAAGGAIAEVLKLMLRRERPDMHAGEHVFRPFGEGLLNSSGLGLPSSHTMIAFAAAGALCKLFPRAAPIWLLAAAGCGYTRMLDHAHFLSDVFLGAVLGYATAWAIALLGPKETGA
jgi:membrane-associated phospholipid phosphatase